MSQSRIVVVSTERDAGVKARACLMSVASQEEPHQHVFYDDGSEQETQDIVADTSLLVHAMNRLKGSYLTRINLPRSLNRSAMQNLYEAVHALEPDCIVCWVDGDDYLAHPQALNVIRQQYESRDVWMTWGQFVYSDGRGGWAADYPAEVRMGGHYRQHPWVATHLKTFRAGLFQKIKQDDLMREINPPEMCPPLDRRDWITRCTDLAVMYPMLEMAGDRGRFIAMPLYVYTGSNTLEGPGTEAWNEALRIRAMPKYERLTDRPW